MCRAAGVKPPVFEEITGGAVVTFRVRVDVTATPTPQVAPQVTPQVTPHVEVLLRCASAAPVTRAHLQQVSGIADRKHFRVAYLGSLLRAGWIEPTIPDKPNSRLQRYRVTPAGEEILARSEQ